MNAKLHFVVLFGFCCLSDFLFLGSLLFLLSNEKHPPRVEVGVFVEGWVQLLDLWIASLLDQQVFQHLDEPFLIAAVKACIRQCGADLGFRISPHKESDRCFAEA